MTTTIVVPRWAVEVGQQVEHVDLVGEVEVGRRLVEQQQVGLLRQGHGDPDPLALAAAHVLDAPVGQLGRARRGERVRHGLVVGGAPVPEPALVRVAAAADEVGHRDALGRDGGLRQQAEHPRDLLARRVVHALAVEQHRAADRARRAGPCPRSSVDLPQPFAPTTTVIRPSGMATVRSSTTGRVPVREHQALRLEAVRRGRRVAVQASSADPRAVGADQQDRPGTARRPPR